MGIGYILILIAGMTGTSALLSFRSLSLTPTPSPSQVSSLDVYDRLFGGRGTGRTLPSPGSDPKPESDALTAEELLKYDDRLALAKITFDIEHELLQLARKAQVELDPGPLYGTERLVEEVKQLVGKGLIEPKFGGQLVGLLNVTSPLLYGERAIGHEGAVRIVSDGRVLLTSLRMARIAYRLHARTSVS